MQIQRPRVQRPILGLLKNKERKDRVEGRTKLLNQDVSRDIPGRLQEIGP